MWGTAQRRAPPGGQGVPRSISPDPPVDPAIDAAIVVGQAEFNTPRWIRCYIISIMRLCVRWGSLDISASGAASLLRPRSDYLKPADGAVGGVSGALRGISVPDQTSHCLLGQPDRGCSQVHCADIPAIGQGIAEELLA
jgi:hypothetical protein